MKPVLAHLLLVASSAALWAQKLATAWPPDDEICHSLIKRTLGTTCHYLTYETFPLRSENDGLAILYTRGKDTLWILFYKEPSVAQPVFIEQDLTAWYVRNRNDFPENELLVEKNRLESCYRITQYRLWGFSAANRLTNLWEAADREMDNTSCSTSLRPCTLLEESHSPQWLDLDNDGIPEWVDNIRLIHLKDPARKTRETFYVIQIWRWQGRELRLTGMDFSP